VLREVINSGTSL